MRKTGTKDWFPKCLVSFIQKFHIIDNQEKELELVGQGWGQDS